MDPKKLDHINDLVNHDELNCLSHIKAIHNSAYSEEAKNILLGYFRERSNLNQKILTDNTLLEEQNG